LGVRRRQVDPINLLLRFFDLEGGRILIDGQDEVEDWKKRRGYDS
jgi:hypothetical protein